MAGLFLVSTSDARFSASALAEAKEQFALHGFPEPAEHALSGWTLLHFPHIIGGPDNLLVRGEDLVAVAGTFTCDGLMGRAALERLLDMDLARGPDWSRIGGQFAALVHRNGETRIFTDYFAAFQLFRDCDGRLFSSSMLAAVHALPRVSFDPLGVYEFAFNAVAIGDDTIFSELKLLGPDRMAALGHSGVRWTELDKPLPERPDRMALSERIERHRERLSAVTRTFVSAFGDNAYCALSGGLDSRLVFAALRAEGCSPNAYVYGSEDDVDVVIARRIGEALGFEVEWLDKENYRRVEPDAFADQVRRNFHEYDALPNYGELFENGANAAGRDGRHRNGAMSASGGCGEIYRNFFFLPDRPATASTVARSFFARYSKRDTTSLFDEKAFLRRIEDKILAAVGAEGVRSRLPRAVLEQVYPRVRCRSMFGKEISLEGRYGSYLMPFLDHHVVAEGIRLPMRLKNAGRFEASLLNAIDPELSRQPSAYGHDFASPPSLRHRFDEWSTRIRPAWLRQRSYALRRRLGPMADEHGGLLTPEWIGRVVDPDYPVMRRFFRVESINDSSLMRRIACLEYLASRLGPRLTG